MAKKILIVLGVLVLVGLIALGIVYMNLNGKYGLSTAPAADHTAVTTPDTRLRIAVNTLQLGKDALPYLPENLPIPGWVPWDIAELLQMGLPREVAVVGGSDYSTNALNLKVFANEQKGGPALPEYLNKEFSLPVKFPAVTWDSQGFTLEERGLLTAQGYLPLPVGLEDAILEAWDLEGPSDALEIHGGHLAEGVIDNRNGEIVTLIGGLAPLWDTTLATLKENPQFGMVMGIVENIHNLRLAVDFKNPDVVLIQIRIHAEEDTGGTLDFIVPMAMPQLAKQVQAQYQLTLESEAEWRADEETYVVDITLTGVEERIRNYVLSAIPTAPPAS
jgi:hypothetical protein